MLEAVRCVVPRWDLDLDCGDASEKAVANVFNAIVQQNCFREVLKDSPLCWPALSIDVGQVELLPLFVHDDCAESALRRNTGQCNAPEA